MLSWLCFWALVISTAPASPQATLPLEVQIDLALVEFERAVEREDHDAVLELIGRLRTLSPASAEGDLLFFEAEAAIALEDLDRAEAALTRFVSTVGRGSELYSAALNLLADLPGLRDSAAERRRAEFQAQLERARESDRQEQIREEQEREQRMRADRDGERRILRDLETLRSIRFILHMRYGNRLVPPDPTTLSEPFSDEERRWIGRFLRDPTLRYVDETAFATLQQRARLFTPLSGADLTRPFGYERWNERDWSWMRVSATGCRAQTVADDFPAGSVFVRPALSVSFDRDWDRSWIGMGLVNPNPYRTDRPITLRIDESQHRLGVHENGRSIVPLDDWSAVTRALAAGRRIEITGTDVYTDTVLTIGFSAIGFTTALRNIAALCDRTSELGRWLRAP